MEKVIRDGKVAVIISPGYGAGLYTWNSEYPALLFDPALVEAVEKKDFNKAEELARELCDGGYVGGIHDAEIEWLPIGTKFRVEEYDGSESIRTVNDFHLTA